MRDLRKAWVRMPGSALTRRTHRRLIEKFALPEPHFSKTDPKIVHSLKPLLLLDGQERTSLAHWVLGEEIIEESPAASIQPWSASQFSLNAGPQADYTHLYETEEFLQAYAPQRYLLTPAALRLVAQRGDLPQLVSILERGLQHPIDLTLAARILGQPAARLLQGAVLEFDSPQELAVLRQILALRARLDRMLSSRHVFVPDHVRADILAGLRRRGIPVSDPTYVDPAAAAPPPSLSTGELAELYSLALDVQKIHLPFRIAPGLLERLANLLPLPYEKPRPPPGTAISPEALNPTPSTASLECVPAVCVETLQRAAERSETLPVWYQTAAGRTAERRWITPLLIEQRGISLYLIAYCHERLSNRTFRQDRLRLESEQTDLGDATAGP